MVQGWIRYLFVLQMAFELYKMFWSRGNTNCLSRTDNSLVCAEHERKNQMQKRKTKTREEKQKIICLLGKTPPNNAGIWISCTILHRWIRIGFGASFLLQIRIIPKMRMQNRMYFNIRWALDSKRMRNEKSSRKKWNFSYCLNYAAQTNKMEEDKRKP